MLPHSSNCSVQPSTCPTSVTLPRPCLCFFLLELSFLSTGACPCFRADVSALRRLDVRAMLSSTAPVVTGPLLPAERRSGRKQ